MKLTHDTIKSIFQGVVFFEDGPSGGLIPRRFSRAQLDAYAYHEAFSIRTCASSGSCLAWETNANEMVLKFRCFTGSAQNFYGFDLMVNGLLFAHLEGSISEKPEAEWHVALPEGTKSLKLHLPCLAGVEIISLELPGATVCKPVKHLRRILFMGDSITMGYIAHFPSGTYPARIAAAMNAEYLNQAVGGETFHPEILDASLDWSPDLIILAYGTNDWALKDRDTFVKDASEFTRRISGIWPKTPIAMLTHIWRADHLTRRDDDFLFMDATRIMEDIAAKYPNIRLIHGENFVPWVPELMHDHVHPNDLGFGYYAERLLTELKALNLA